MVGIFLVKGSSPYEMGKFEISCIHKTQSKLRHLRSLLVFPLDSPLINGSSVLSLGTIN